MYKIAIIGCGWVGQQHAAACKVIKSCKLTAVVDPQKELSAKVASQFGGNAYGSLEELLKKDIPDIVIVCTPPSSHRKVVETALKKGVRNIVSEKPLAHNLTDARAIQRAVKSASARFMTAFCHRFVDPVIQTRKIIKAGKLGEIVFFRNQFSSYFEGVQNRWFSNPEIAGGGCLIDTSVHSIDLFRFLCGDVKNVSARTAAHMPGIKVEDTSCLLMQNANGCIGVIEASWNVGVGQAYLEVCGTKGRIIYEYWGPFRMKLAGDKDWRILPIRRDINHRFEDELKNFISIIEGKKSEGPGVEDGVRASEVIDSAYLSVKDKKWVSP